MMESHAGTPDVPYTINRNLPPEIPIGSLQDNIIEITEPPHLDTTRPYFAATMPFEGAELEAAIAHLRQDPISLRMYGAGILRDAEYDAEAFGYQTQIERLETERDGLEEELHELEYTAHHDPMTGLETRQAWQGGVDAEVERLSQPGAKGGIAVLLLDVDHFKEVNDRKGHGIGDGVLGAMGSILEHVPDADGDVTEERVRVFAQRLTDTMRGNDTIAHEKLYEVPFGRSRGSRFGGDEFALMIHLREPAEGLNGLDDITTPAGADPDSSQPQERRDPQATYEDQVEGAIDRIKDVFDSFVNQHPDLDIPGLGISVGAAIWRPGMNTHELMDAADKAMYETKQNQFTLYYSQLSPEAQAAWREAYHLLEENGGYVARLPKLPPIEAA